MIQSTQIKLARRQAFIVCFVAGQLFLIGCGGGGTSQSEMRRNAIRRTPKEEADAALPMVGSNESSDAQQQGTAPQKSAVSPKPVAEPAAGDAVASQAVPGQPTLDIASTRNEDVVTGQSAAIPSALSPAESLSPADRRERTASNLTRIGKAWRRYLDDKGHFPGPILSHQRQPILSWRIELLPYLGLQSLYDAFHLDESWDSPHNFGLLAQIPRVFQSPERFDAKTNYVALSLSGKTVYHELRKQDRSDVEDGIQNTLALVEVDDERAVPWTQPTELPLDMAAPLQSLGNLRENGMFVVWSDGKASWIGGAVNPQAFANACTIATGDGFRGSQIALELAIGFAMPGETSKETAADEMVAAVAEQHAADTVAATGEKEPPTLGNAQASVKSERKHPPQNSWQRKPIPATPDLKIARDLLRNLFQAEYAAATTDAQRSHFASRLLDHLSDLDADIPGQYALLEVVIQISIQTGDVAVALEATDQMAARFELGDDVLLDALEKLTRTASDQRGYRRLLEESDVLFEDFVASERYEAAERISQLAVAAAHKAIDKNAFVKFSGRRQWASEAKTLLAAAEKSLATLETNPQDPRANCDVGRFLCLIKNDWENGLVILAHGNDRSLARLAEMELGDLSDALRRLELADLWLREAESATLAFRATMQNRARHWYEQALPGLPAGLVRIRVERRIEELSKDRSKT